MEIEIDKLQIKAKCEQSNEQHRLPAESPQIDELVLEELVEQCVEQVLIQLQRRGQM
ncbi:hypothetical protein PRUB_a0083 [Pseudoalteromonas rubra]|uniref:Uncharacterized protein n=1 Tax=Pseudoalteromonas rubra TaxID=43658 RepID=A0A8T0C5P9_9GAMM|nr:hypothetical protein [Pseudoalteromonas rubra]KAF7785718.1 hypothetical protein PRUB_a0083 [Pseudoalteromonas rubra]